MNAHEPPGRTSLIEPSIEVALGIEAPLDGPEAMDVAYDLSEIVSQSRNLSVEIRGHGMQIGMAFAEGGVISGAISAPQQGRSGVANGFGPPSVTRALGSALPLPGDHLFGMTPGDIGQDSDAGKF